MWDSKILVVTCCPNLNRQDSAILIINEYDPSAKSFDCEVTVVLQLE